jgi:sugar lactone lactonase YvrE
LAVDAQGDVFIADTYNNRVVKVTPRGQVFAVAGTGRSGYSGDRGLAVLASLNLPTGLALDAKGNLYIADSANNLVRRVDAVTGIITTVAGNYDKAKANDGLGGFVGDGGPATEAQLNCPQGVAVDGAGDLFIADTFNHAIRMVTPDGTVSTVVNHAGAGGEAPSAGGESSGQAPSLSRLNSPSAVAIDQSANVLYIADTKNSAIAEVLNLAQPGTAAGPTAK